MRSVVGAALLVACGGASDVTLEPPCDGAFYEDADGDGWGARDGAAECEADAGRSITATNNRDCDDGDPHVRGQVGAACPADLAADWVGVVYQDRELVAIGGDPMTSGANQVGCELWAGPDGGALAQLDEGGLAYEVQTAIEATGASAWAAHVGASWDGSAEVGSWQWEAGPVKPLEPPWAWCGLEEPVPFDFMPHMDPTQPDHVAAVDAVVPDLRLAAVLDGGAWCLGVPTDTTSELEAMAICERSAPDPLDYAEAP